VVTALARYTLRGATVQLPRPSQALAALNEVMLRDDTDRFCTVALLRLQAQDGAWRATISLGGHAKPLLVRSGQPAVPFGAPGTLLGVLPTPELLDTAVQLQPGDSLILFTDGVTEGRSGAAFYGDERLTAAVSLAAPDADARVQRLLDDVLDFQDGVASDDIAIVVVRVPD
jgi:sigma-B regulation protein RsbU (phosphoserine phosphatase)